MSDAKMDKLRGMVYGALAVPRVLFERAKASKRAVAAFRIAGAVLLLTLVMVAEALAVGRYAGEKAVENYKAALARQQAEAAEANWTAYQEDPYTVQLDAEANLLAKVLYGVRENSTDDLITCCWCVFNRVDNPAFPNTLEEVVNTPKQWMRYSADNPVLDSLYKLAREQLNEWHTGARRPVADSFVFLNWAPDDICLRDNWQGGSSTHYWRWNQ